MAARAGCGRPRNARGGDLSGLRSGVRHELRTSVPRPAGRERSAAGSVTKTPGTLRRPRGDAEIVTAPHAFRTWIRGPGTRCVNLGPCRGPNRGHVIATSEED